MIVSRDLCGPPRSPSEVQKEHRTEARRVLGAKAAREDGACVSELITRAFLDGVYHNEPQLVQASNSL